MMQQAAAPATAAGNSRINVTQSAAVVCSRPGTQPPGGPWAMRLPQHVPH
jgi:hypothetical protein